MKKIIIIIIALFPLLACSNQSIEYSKVQNEELKVETDELTKKLLAIDKSEFHTPRDLNNSNFEQQQLNTQSKNNSTMKEATFGAGCFWCIEACFLDIEGIVSVVPGYAGGQRQNPTYEQVCSGATGHAEVARIVYDETKISFDELLEMFWFVHDPTQLNRQGNDIGTQYRSVIFYHSEEQKIIAEKYKAKLEEEKVWDNPIVTEIVEINNYFEAEKYHHNYLELNPENAYCRAIVRPKVDKFKKVFSSKLK